MGNFNRNITETFEFDGDTISVEMLTLTRAESMQLAPYLGGEIDRDKQSKLMNVAAEILPNKVIAISGLMIDGSEVKREDESFKTVMSEFYFLPFLVLVLSKLLERSSVSKDKEKKSDKKSEDTSPVQTSSTTSESEE